MKLQELESPSLGHISVSDPAGHLHLLPETSNDLSRYDLLSDKTILEHRTSAMQHLVKANHTCVGLDWWLWKTQAKRRESYLHLTRVTWNSRHGSK